MPTILRNNDTSVEIDIHANLKYAVSKGGFDVIYEDSGIEATAMVYVVLRSQSLINNTIKLDWRDCTIMPGETPFTSAENLRDTLLGWNKQAIIVSQSALPTGAATSDNQTNGDQLTRIEQHVIADDNNSSDANLAADDTFTGSATSTLNCAGIQVSLKTTENCTVYVDQSPDGINWDISDRYNYYASINNFGITIQAINSYFRVRVKNEGSATTTEFRLHSVLCPVVESLPRSLDSDGNLKVGIKSIEDLYGFEVENTPIGEMRVIVPTRLVGANFEGTTLDAVFWTASVANNGTVAQGNSQVVLSTATTSPNGTARVYSARRGRYVSGFSMQYRAVVQLSAGAANNKRRWGIAFGASLPTITDGAFFEIDGTTCSIVTMKGTNETRISSGDFNGTLGDIFSFGTGVRTYEIYWTNSKVYFVIGGKVLHTVSADDATWADTMNHYIYFDNVNSNNLQTNHTLTCRVASLRRLGPLLTQPTYYYHALGTTAGVNLKLGPGNLHSIIVNNVANNAVITLSDSTSATTPTIWAHTAGATSTSAYAIDFKGLPFSTGLRLTVSAANASVTVIYE